MATKDWQPWVRLKWKAGAPADAWHAWKGNPAVKGAWSTQGDWDCTLWLNVTTPEELEDFVWKKVRGNQWVDTTETHWAKQWFMTG